jgi:hypothetical protein
VQLGKRAAEVKGRVGEVKEGGWGVVVVGREEVPAVG